MTRRKDLLPEPPKRGTYIDKQGTRWDCAWHVIPHRPHSGPTIAYLRRIDDGPGPHTHTARIEIDSALFNPYDLGGQLELVENKPPHVFTMMFN